MSAVDDVIGDYRISPEVLVDITEAAKLILEELRHTSSERLKVQSPAWYTMNNCSDCTAAGMTVRYRSGEPDIASTI